MSASAVRAGEAFVEVTLRDKMKQGARSIQAQMSVISAGVKSLGAGLLTASAGATAAFGGLLASLAWPTKIAADMETTRAGFLAILRDGGKVEGLMANLKKFGAETPFEFPELAKASQMLLAFGVPLEQIMGTLKSIGDVSSGINAPLGEIAEIYGKARVQGRLFMEDINQLTGRGIPVIQELAKQFGVTDGEIRGLVENGSVNFSHLEKAFGSLTTGAGIFAGQMETKSKTLNGIFSTLKDNITGALMPIGEALSQALKPILQVVNSLLAPLGSFIAANKSIAPVIAGVAAGGAALSAAMAGVGAAVIAAGGAVSAIGVAAPLLTGLATALAPLLPVIAAVGAAVVGVGASLATLGYFAYQAGILTEVFNGITAAASDLYKTAAQTFSGIASALSDGNFSKAGEVAMAGIKLAFLQGSKAVYDGIVWLVSNAGRLLLNFAKSIGETLFNLFKSIPKLLHAAISGGASFAEILSQAFTGGLSESLNASIAEAQKNLDALTAKKGQPGKGTAGDGKAPLLAGSSNLKPIDEEKLKAELENKKAIEERIAALREENTELRIGANAADLLKLKQQGATAEQISAVQSLQAQRDALKAKQKAEDEAKKKAEDLKRQAEDDRKDMAERGKKMAEEVRTPFQVLQDKLKEINQLEAGGFIDKNTANLQRQAAAEDFNRPLRDAVSSGRNTVAEINTQAALDVVLRTQRSFRGSSVKSPEDLQKETNTILNRIADAVTRGDANIGGGLKVVTRKI